MRKFLFKQLVELTGNEATSTLLKNFATSRLSQPIIRPFANTYNINQAEMEYPIEHYKSLHALFTRKLRPGVRQIDPNPNTIISPVDGIVKEMGTISPNQNFHIKNQLYQLNDILGDSEKAKTYQNGYFFIIYLSPMHYHRFHYPIKGSLSTRYALGEKSFPVNDLGLRFGDKPFATNYRIISELITSYGKVGFIKVGALNINSIDLINPADKFDKGEELGYFSFGSTIILLLDKQPKFTPTIEVNTEVQLGQSIGKWE